MKHYYTNNEDLKSNQETFTYNYKRYSFLFTSDNGVFSKTMIDYGSRVMLDNIIIKNDQKSLLDVGCGYGTFGICLKKRYPQLDVDMIDVNDRALSLAKINAKNNSVNVKIYESYIYDNVNKKYDVIVTNPPIRAGKQVVSEIVSKSYEYLNENGEVWIVIQKKQGAPSTKKRLIEIYGNCDVIKRDKGYYILRSIKI